MKLLEALDILAQLPSQAQIAANCSKIIREYQRKIADLEHSNIALETLRPLWAQGYSSDSVAAQASSNALAEIWEILGVNNQTDAMEKLRELVQ